MQPGSDSAPPPGPAPAPSARAAMAASDPMGPNPVIRMLSPAGRRPRSTAWAATAAGSSSAPCSERQLLGDRGQLGTEGTRRPLLGDRSPLIARAQVQAVARRGCSSPLTQWSWRCRHEISGIPATLFPDLDVGGTPSPTARTVTQVCVAQGIAAGARRRVSGCGCRAGVTIGPAKYSCRCRARRLPRPGRLDEQPRRAAARPAGRPPLPECHGPHETEPPS